MMEYKKETQPQQPSNFLKRIAPALGLFFLAPLTAEYLIGYLDSTGDFINLLIGLLFLAPLYGGAALIIREITRRAGRSWPTILLLAAAFGVFQAGMVDHSLFNPSFMDIEWWEEALNPTYIPALGISGYFTLNFILGHVFWSIGAPIVVVEALVPERKSEPWLGKPGLGFIAILYLLASALIFMDIVETEQFLPSTAQFVGTAVLVIALIAAAFTFTGRPRPVVDRPAPSPWMVGAVVLIVLSLPTLLEVAFELLGASSQFIVDWRGFALNSGLYLLLALLVWRWSHSKEWHDSHLLALAGGALLNRAWIAFLVEPVAGDVALAAKLFHNAVFFLGVIVLLLMAARTIRRAAVDFSGSARRNMIK